MAKQEVAKPESLFPQEIPESARGNGRGNEQVGDDVARPVIKLLQQLSPQLQSHKPEYVENAKVGQFFNTVSGQVYDELYVSNLYYYKNFAVFRKQEHGGGFEGNYDTREDAHAFLEAGNMNLDQYDVIETARHVVAIIDTETGDVEPAEFLMSSTKLRISDQWNSNISKRGGDRFSSVWHLTSRMETRGQNTFAQVHIDFAGFTPPELYELCAESYDLIRSQHGAPKNTEAA